MTTRTDRLETTPRRLRRIYCCGAIGVFAFTFISAANPPAPPAPNAAGSEIPIVLAQATNPLGANAASPMDEPIRLITEAKKAIAAVKDYSCVLIKKEKMGDKAPVENVISLRIRAEPFSVNMRWMEPKVLVGQEACYVTGKNDGRMRVKSAGLLGNLGYLSVAPDDARAKATSKHAITESGLANMIDQFVIAWEKERKLNVTKVRLAEYEYNKRRCVRVETTQTANPDNQLLFQRTIVYFDKETHLPIRLECYDWPTKDGEAGELAESYSYVNLRLNVGLGDDVFNH
jgi:Protein of unknown function (DUF1571)